MTECLNRIFSKKLICAAIVVSIAAPSMSVFAQAVPDQSAPAAVAASEASLPASSPVSTTTAVVEPVSPQALQVDAAVVVPASAVNTAVKPLLVIYSYRNSSGGMTKSDMDDLLIVHARTTQNQVVAQVALSVAMLVLVGGVGVSTFGKEDLKGEAPKDLKDKNRSGNPARTLLLADLQRESLEWLAANPKTNELKFTQPLVITGASWRLIYNSLSADDQIYRLRLDVGVYKTRDKSSFFQEKIKAGKDCLYVSEPRTLNEWKANDYQAVTDSVPVAVAKCSKEFVAQLPVLLELK